MNKHSTLDVSQPNESVYNFPTHLRDQKNVPNLVCRVCVCRLKRGEWHCCKCVRVTIL